jgi:hypothetical protein
LTLGNKRVIYGVLFDAVAQTLLEVAANPKHLGARIGFLAILHTWGQNLSLHPHVHCVVPGGGITPQGQWVSCRTGFFLPVRVLSRVFRGKFIDLLKRARAAGKLSGVDDDGEFDRLIDASVQHDWVVYAKPPFGGPEQVLFESPENVANLPKESFDDIIYFGADKAIIELLNDKLAARGIINIVLCGQKIGQPVSVGIGRVHYGMTRWIGTRGHSAAASYHYIPPTGELRRGDHAVIIGAGCPMGQMHVIRGICSGVSGISVTGTDMDDGRLESLRKKAQPLAKANRVDLRLINTQKNPLNEKFTYFALMAPVGALAANAIRDSNKLSIINIFAGIPATTRHEIDLDTYIANHCYMIGTSGSVIRDMLIVLQKVQDNQLDTNCSVDAVSGMAGATDGIAAVENRTLAGKILVYPMLHELGLTPLSELPKKFPTVAAKLQNGNWCRAAELELLHVAK